MIRKVIGVLAIVGCIAFAITARDQSASFQTCVSEQYADHGAQQQIKGSADLSISLIDQWPVRLQCTGKFIDVNNAAINAISTVVIAIFTVVLANVSRIQTRLTKEALIADKRAFVFAIQLSPGWERAGDEYHWRLRPIWRNSGSTPTKKLRFYLDCEIRNSVLPPGFAFRHDTAKIGQGLLAPKSESPAGQSPPIPSAAITPQDIIDTQNGRKFIYLWGWARYFDVFPGTVEHVTHYCWFITASGDPKAYDPATDNLRFHFVHHPDGNYAEEPES